MNTKAKARKDDDVQPRVEIPSDEARQKLGDLIDRAGFRGERIVITRHGKPIVALVSVEDLDVLESATANAA
jgi:prevent-host-death family protein